MSYYCSALSYRDKCRTGGGFLEADKTAFAFLPFWSPSCLTLVARMACTVNRLSQGRAHMGDHACAWTDERFWYPACDNSSHRSVLWWQHPISSTCPVLLTSWHSCRGENHNLSLAETSEAALLFTTDTAQIKCHLQRTLWSLASLFITISNYWYLRLLQWNWAGENLLSIDKTDSEIGELMALGYQSFINIMSSVCISTS